MGHDLNKAPKIGNAVTKAIGRLVLKGLGWHIDGTPPNRPKIIIAAEPHTSNIDFIVIMAASLALGTGLSYIMKQEAFFWPFGGLFKKLGGVPINRSNGAEMYDNLTKQFESSESMWLSVTPKGQRIAKDKYKTGYLRLAEQFDVPILLVGIDGQNKRLVVDGMVERTGNLADQNTSIQTYFENTYSGVNPQNQKSRPDPEAEAPSKPIGYFPIS